MSLAQQELKDWTWYDFTRTNLDLVPRTSGVYCLGLSDNIIYIGTSNNLHERLADHLYTSDLCIKQATRFAIEPCVNYREKERQLLEWFRSKYGRLPRCNDRV